MPDTQATTKLFDFEALRHAMEHSEADEILRLYADDAELCIIDRSRPPSMPMRFVGKPAQRLGHIRSQSFYSVSHA